MNRIILLKLLLISATLCFSQRELPQTDSTYWLPEKYVEDLLMNKDPSINNNILSNTGLVENAPVVGRAWYRIEIEDVKGNRINHILFVNGKSGFEIYPTKTDERNRHFLTMSSKVMLSPIKNVPK